MQEGRDTPTLTDGAGGPPPVDLPSLVTDEGPMRGELRRQIERLEKQLAELKASAWSWGTSLERPKRGPAVLTTSQLEEVRDELYEELNHLRAKVAEADFAALEGLDQTPDSHRQEGLLHTIVRRFTDDRRRD